MLSCRFFRIGTIILALHDTSDVFLETAKLCKYTEKELGASLFFGLFAISWLLLRLIYYPLWIIRTSRFVTYLQNVFHLYCLVPSDLQLLTLQWQLPFHHVLEEAVRIPGDFVLYVQHDASHTVCLPCVLGETHIFYDKETVEQ
jgi:hypothetical protein